jgi:septum formation protein
LFLNSKPETRNSKLTIYLASSSPRRQELLRQIGVEFEVVPSAILEVPVPGEAAEDYVRRVARDKARAVAARLAAAGRAARPVLGADTEVVLDGEILGKPRDAAHARAMLARLAGRSHEVLSAVVLVNGAAEHAALSRSRVTLAPLGDAAIERYCASGEPLDKAGGYAIQGRAAAFVTRIEGSYSGIVGLPLDAVAALLAQAGVEGS